MRKINISQQIKIVNVSVQVIWVSVDFLDDSHAWSLQSPPPGGAAAQLLDAELTEDII